MALITKLFFILLLAGVFASQECKAPNACVSFTVGPGTGCAWMCEHCADVLGPSYYFLDGVCAYQAGGCVGNPQAGVTYTCCSTSVR